MAVEPCDGVHQRRDAVTPDGQNHHLLPSPLLTARPNLRKAPLPQVQRKAGHLPPFPSRYFTPKFNRRLVPKSV